MADSNLEEILTNAEKRVQRALDYEEISNVMAMHSWHYQAYTHREEMDKYWARKTPGVRWTIFGAAHEGLEAVRALYIESSEQQKMKNLERLAKWYPIEVKPENMSMGDLLLHIQCTPVIEVAGDGQTAKGVWYSPGIIGDRIDDNGKPIVNWMYEKYAVDFIKEDGRWKIWHLHNYYDFVIDLGKGFADVTWPAGYEKSQFVREGLTARLLPGGDPYAKYSPTRVPQFMPVPPEPYETFDEKDAY